MAKQPDFRQIYRDLSGRNKKDIEANLKKVKDEHPEMFVMLKLACKFVDQLSEDDFVAAMSGEQVPVKLSKTELEVLQGGGVSFTPGFISLFAPAEKPGTNYRVNSDIWGQMSCVATQIKDNLKMLCIDGSKWGPVRPGPGTSFDFGRDDQFRVTFPTSKPKPKK